MNSIRHQLEAVLHLDLFPGERGRERKREPGNEDTFHQGSHMLS